MQLLTLHYCSDEAGCGGAGGRGVAGCEGGMEGGQLPPPRHHLHPGGGDEAGLGRGAAQVPVLVQSMRQLHQLPRHQAHLHKWSVQW